MDKKPPRPAIVAAIPNFNMGSHLRSLLPQVTAQGYDHVFVLDDASTDDSCDVVAEFGEVVTMVRSDRNGGAGANRNKILDHVDDATYVHFIDADMDLVTPECANTAVALLQSYAGMGVVALGGLVRRADGQQEPFNFGPVFGLRASLSAFSLQIDRARHQPGHKLGWLLQRVAVPGSDCWPRVFSEPVPQAVFWLHEGNMLIPAGAFREAGAYDPAIRAHEALDLAMRLELIGVKRFFDPTIEVVHHDIDVRGRNRSKYEREAILYLLRKHGVRRFLKT